MLETTIHPQPPNGGKYPQEYKEIKAQVRGSDFIFSNNEKADLIERNMLVDCWPRQLLQR
jgi:hypothetical protein